MNKIKDERDECHTYKYCTKPTQKTRQVRVVKLLLHNKHPINMNLNKIKTVS